jgi:hypothetical protein
MNWQETAIVIGLFALRIGVPLLITLGIGHLISRYYNARQPVPVDETALIARADYELGPPCWEIKNCDPTIRESCPAYQRPQIPCWLALQVAGRDLPEECFSCEIFQRTQPVIVGDVEATFQGG